MDRKKQKILLVHNYYQIPGGEDTVVENEMRLLKENGHKVLLYSRTNSEIKTMSKFWKLLLPFIAVFNIKTYWQIKKIIKEKHIDIVHVHNTLTLISPSVYYAAVKCRIPVVQTIHNFRLLCPGATFYRNGNICEDCVNKGLRCAIKHNCYRDSKLQTLVSVFCIKFHRLTGIYKKINYICLTEFNKEKLLLFKQIKPEQVFIKPNFVFSDKECISADAKWPNQYIFVGRIDKLKGVDILLRAWKKMNNTDFKLMICGIGPMEDWCKKYIADNQLINVKMKGFVSNEEVRSLIANCKALILPTQWYEGFPMTVLEAVSAGTPVICSNLGNVGSLIKDGVNGYKFDYLSSDALIRAIYRLNKNVNIRDSVIDVYKSKYTMDRNYNSLISVYDYCIICLKKGRFKNNETN